MQNLKIILFLLICLQATAQVQLYDLAPADSTTTFDSVPGGPDFIGITILDTIGLDDYLQIYKKLTVAWTYKTDSVCLSIIDDGREPTCFKIDTAGGGGGTDTYAYSGVYADDTITVYRTDDGATSIDSFKIYLPPCPLEMIKVNDTTVALINCLDDTLSQITLPKCIQDLYALPDSSNRVVLTYCDGTPKDTVDFFGGGMSGFNDTYTDSSSVWRNDTVIVYRYDMYHEITDSFPIVIPRDSIDSYAYRGTFQDDTLTIVRKRAGVDLDSFKVEIIIDSDTDIDSMKMIGNVLHLWEDGVHLTTDLSQFLDNTDDQQISLITDGQQDTIILEDGGQIVLHDSVGVSAVVALNGLHNIAPDSVYLGGQLVEDTRIRGNEDAPGLNEFSFYFDTLKNYQITASTNLYQEKIRDTTFSNNRIYNLLGAGQNSSFFYDFGNNTAGRFLINNTGLYLSWGDTSDVDSKSALYMNNSGTFINPEDQAGSSEIDSLYVLTAIDANGRAKWQSAEQARLLDYDFAQLRGDTALDDIQSRLPLDSLDIDSLVWRSGTVRIGNQAYAQSIYRDPATGTYWNFVLDQDSATTGLQIYGKRSALDIYHSLQPYKHFRNDYGEFWERVFDPSGEGPLLPQRWEFGAVGKYDTDGMENFDTTSRPIFTIMNDADAFSLNITNGYLQSDIYTSDRPVDTTVVYGLFAADSTGQFILLPFDSLGAINVVNPPDSDWLVPVTNAIPGIADDRYTEGRVRIGQDSIETTSAQVIIQGGAAPLLTYGSATANLFRQGTRSNNQRWDYLVQGGALSIYHGDDDAMTQGRYLYMEGGFDGSSFDIMTLRQDGDVSFGLYPNTRDDGDVSDSITRIYYPDWNGNLLLASIDSLAAALSPILDIPDPDGSETIVTAGTGIGVAGTGTSGDPYIVSNTSLADKLGSAFGSGAVLVGSGTPTGKTDSTMLFWDDPNDRLGLGTNLPGNGISYDTKLHVKGSGSSTGGRTAIVLENTTANSAALLHLQNSSGNAATLQITGPSFAVPSVASFSTVGVPIRFGTDGNVASGGTNQIVFGPGGYSNDFVYFTPTKKAGFAISSPEETLDVLNFAVFRNTDSGSSTSQMFLGYGTNPRHSGLSTRNQITAVSTTVSTIGLQITSLRHLGTEGSESDWTSTSANNMIIGSNVWRNGAYQAQAQIRFADDGSHGVTNPTGNLTFWTSDPTTGLTERIRIDPDGEVGIGTTNPTNALHVVGGGTFSGLAGTGTRMVTASSAGVLSTAAIPSGADGDGIYTTSGTVGGGSSSVTATVGTSNNFNIAHQSVNKLGIGTSGTFLRSTTGNSVLVGETTNEWGLYHDSGSAQTRIRNVERGSSTYFFIGDSGSGGGLQSTGSISFVGSSTSVSATSGTLGLTASGSVDMSAGSTIDLGATSSMSFTGTQFLFSDNSSNLYIFESAGNMNIGNANATGGSAEYITITSSTIGINVGGATAIGAATNNVELHGGVAGTYGLEVSGTQASSSATTFTVVSDRRQKENIVPIGDAYDKIMSLNPVTFNYNDEYLKRYNQEKKLKKGFIAQDYQEVFPEDVYDNEGTLSMNVDAVTPYSVAAIQQLIQDNEQQAAQIEVLTDQVNKLYQLINRK